MEGLLNSGLVFCCCLYNCDKIVNQHCSTDNYQKFLILYKKNKPL